VLLLTLLNLLDCVSPYFASSNGKGDSETQPAPVLQSKQQFQPKLNTPRAIRGKDSAERRRADEVIWQTKVRMVEQIEELRAELDHRGFPQRGVLDKREVDVFVTRPVQNVAAGGAETAERRDDEGRRIEPPVRRRVLQFGPANQVGPVIAQKPEVRDAGVAVVEFGQQRDREWAARFKRDHALNLPAPDHP